MDSEPSPPSVTAPTSGGEDALIGTIVDGRYEIVRLLARGGMGVVYEGKNLAIGKRVALKFIDAEFARDADVVSRFQREAEAASAVESSHIVEIFDTGRTENGRPYLVMELLRGETVGQRLRAHGKLPLIDAAQIVAQMLRGLARAHAKGIIHRDLKPDNVFLVTRDDGALFVKIVDFGVSKIRKGAGDLAGGTLTRKGAVVGTPYYMAPEQAQGLPDLDERADLYSVGAILFECITGKPPHHGPSSYEAIIVALCTKDAPDVREKEPSASPAIAAVVKRALAREPDARFKSADEFLDALSEAVPGLAQSRPISLPEGTPVPPPEVETNAAPATKTTWSSRDGEAFEKPTRKLPASRRRVVMLALGTTAVAFALTLLFMRHEAPRPPKTARSADPTPALAVTMRIVTTPENARVLVDGATLNGKTVQGAALTTFELRVEADGFVADERDVVLDGRPELRIDLAPAGAAPLATPTSSSKKLAPPPKASAAASTHGPPGLTLKLDP